jgi:hypothetical protein
MFQDFEEVLAQKNLAAAQSQNKNTGIGHLREQAFDFGSGHLPVVVVVEIAMNALFVAAVGEIELHAEGNAQPPRPIAHFLH